MRSQNALHENLKMSSEDDDFRVEPSSELDEYPPEDEKSLDVRQDDPLKTRGNLNVTADLSSTFKILM